MPRPRRHILANQTYEICMRTTQGLPFVCTNYMRRIIEGIIARVQRDQKVVLSHYIWMGNHPHMVILARDKMQCTRFYGEIQKQITEAIKRLTGLSHLHLWRENGTSVVRIATLDAAVTRIAYLYTNPAAAHLVESIEKYPGLSTWNILKSTPHSLNAEHRKSHPWVRSPMIDKLPCRALTPTQDSFYERKLMKKTRDSHELVIQPNAWMKCYEVEEDEVAEVNRQIREEVVAQEQQLTRERRKAGLQVMGAAKLRTAALDLTYCSKKPFYKIVVYAKEAAARIEALVEYKQFCAACRECYEQWQQGNLTVTWPPGALYPPVPVLVNHFV